MIPAPTQNTERFKAPEVSRGERGHFAVSKSTRFDGRGWILAGGSGGATIGPYHPRNDSLTFSPWESFTLQAWFQTKSRANQTIVANTSEWCLYLEGGRLAAWLMQDGGSKRAATGSQHISDGKWHHGVAVFDRESKQLSLYLDGKLDTVDGKSGKANPVDISMIAASKWPARVTLGGFATWRGFKRQNPFVGSLEDVAVVAAALAPGAELEAALASATTGHPTRHVASGKLSQSGLQLGSRCPRH